MPRSTDIGLRAILEPQMDERETEKTVRDLEDALKEAEELEVDADFSKVEERAEALGLGDDLSFGGEEMVADMPERGLMGRMAGMAEEGGVLDRGANAVGMGGAAAAARKGGGALGGAAGGMLGTVGKALVPVALAGAVGLGILKKLEQASPALQKTMNMFGMAMNLFFRPFGNFLSKTLRPMAKAMLDMAVSWNKLVTDEGLPVAIMSIADSVNFGTGAGKTGGMGVGAGLLNQLVQGGLGDVITDPLEGALEGYFNTSLPDDVNFTAAFGKAAQEWFNNVVGDITDFGKGILNWIQSQWPGWAKFIGFVALDALVNPLQWGNFVSGVNLSGMVPSFPGWEALMGGGPKPPKQQKSPTQKATTPTKSGAFIKTGTQGGGGSPGGGGAQAGGAPTLTGAGGQVAGGGNAMFLQEGGVVTEPTSAVIGEAGPEAVIPLGQLPSMLESAVRSVAGGAAQARGPSPGPDAGGSQRDVERLERKLDEVKKAVEAIKFDPTLKVNEKVLAESSERATDRFVDSKRVDR